MSSFASTAIMSFHENTDPLLHRHDTRDTRNKKRNIKKESRRYSRRALLRPPWAAGAGAAAARLALPLGTKSPTRSASATGLGGGARFHSHQTSIITKMKILRTARCVIASARAWCSCMGKEGRQ